MNYALELKDITVSEEKGKKIAKAVWDRKIEETKQDSFGEFIKKKLLSVKTFIGLK